MTDHGDQGNTGNNGGKGNNARVRGSANGERRYGRPAHRDSAAGGKATGERRYGKSASGSASGERRYGKPAGGSAIGGTTGERRYGKPASGSASDERRYGKPASGSTTGVTTGDRRYGKPASGSAGGERRYGKPASGSTTGVTTGDRRYGKPASGSASGERRYGKPASGSATGGTTSERRYGKPASSSASAERRYGKPAGGGTNAERRYGKSAAGGATTERRYGKPANGSASGSATPDRHYGKPAPRTSSRPSFSRARVPSRIAPAAPAVTEETGLRLGARRLAYDILTDVHQNGAYAALSLTEHLRGKTLSPEDRRLVTNIVYGTLENELQIDYALDKLMEHPTREPSQRDILRMSAYQILFLDRVPDSAAVNEGVKLCKVVGMESASGFINAVLRNLVRGKDEIAWPKREDDLRAYLNIMGSMPMWIVDKIVDEYGADEAERILMHRENAHPVVVRPSFVSFSDEQLEKLLTQKELRFEHGVAPHAYLAYGTTELNYDAEYQKGLFSIQGQSSMLAAEAVQAANGMKILDACAAPGGKSAYLCEKMQMTGRVYAWELHEKRALLLEATKRRLHLENLRISVRDATDPRPDLEGALDAVLLDAPCSGLGVMAQKPDIKLRLKEEDVPAITQAQRRLLDALCAYVKRGGTLVYSTCSILKEENERQIERFLNEHPDFSIEPLPVSFPEAIRARQTPLGLQLLGYRDGMEGFFIARMRRAR